MRSQIIEHRIMPYQRDQLDPRFGLFDSGNDRLGLIR